MCSGSFDSEMPRRRSGAWGKVSKATALRSDALVCSACNQPIENATSSLPEQNRGQLGGALTETFANKRVVFARLAGASKAFHSACFRCCECSTLLQKANAGVSVEWVDENGRPACTPCSVLMHKPTLSCRDCGNRCDGSGEVHYVAADGGEPWCGACWAAREARPKKPGKKKYAVESCVVCGMACGGKGGDEWLEVLGSAYHDQCFCCAACGMKLDPGVFYPVHNKPHCMPCAKAAKKRAKQGGGAGDSSAAAAAIETTTATTASVPAPQKVKKKKKMKKMKKKKVATEGVTAPPPAPELKQKTKTKTKTKKKKKNKLAKPPKPSSKDDPLTTAAYCEVGWERCGGCGMPFESGEDYTIVGTGKNRVAMHGRCFVCKG